jgi:hypothetical protein
MNTFPLDLFADKLESEKKYLNTTQRSRSCIVEIKQAQNIDRFDFVVLDGSLFSGEADLDAVYGANFILLTSINSLKDYANHKRLSEDNDYVLITCNKAPRAGYSMFRRKDYE